ncbi:MAG: DUF881 domain-containing protein [Chloroflexi bacterium]|nr:MAG: DUF881 domain-containing protein [Chloroflexota bacterium]
MAKASIARPGAALVFLLPAFLLGLVATTQLQSQSRRTLIPSEYSSQDSVKLTEQALALQREQTDLKRELTALREQLADLQAQGAGVGGQSTTLQAQLDQLRELAGLTPLAGRGVVVTLDDAHLPPSTNVSSVIQAIVHSEDIVDVLNAAWKAGARAIAVNDERVTGASACVGATIQINGTLMSPPFRFVILGASDELYGALTEPRELTDLRARQRNFGLGFEVARADDLRVPAYSGALRVRYAVAR